jgi:anaerobic magnesium-protoporphyrin IX monomethyl ester cyclase
VRVLLFSMPDGTHPMFPRFCRPPNLGLASLAGNLKEDAEVVVADLILKRGEVPAAVREALDKVRPDLVGLSCMTWQYYTATRIAELVRRWNPDVPIALGGYHASTLYEEIARDDGRLFDLIFRGESEKTLQEAVRTLDRGERHLNSILGLSWKDGDLWHHNPARPVAPLSDIALPDRRSRLWSGYRVHHFIPFDCVETSRGCTMPCNFCSITQMYGRSFRTYHMERILDDLEEAASLGTRQIFFVDDNITLSPGHLERVCRGIISRGLHKRVGFSTQASVVGLARDFPVMELMAEANFSLVFLGIENVSRRNLLAYKKGDIVATTRRVVRELRANRILIMGGFILGSPDDDERDIVEQFEFMRRESLDAFLVQILTPYPKVPLSGELERAGLVVNRDLRRYSGFFANVRTKHLSSRDLDFLRWKHFPYYRDARWFLRATIPRRYPLLFLPEAFCRLGEMLVEKLRRTFVSEEYVFLKYMQKHLAANLFFGEKPEVCWPDVDGSLPMNIPRTDIAQTAVRKDAHAPAEV